MTRRIDCDVAIIGGGLVGSSAALALRGMGFSVTLLDKGFCGAQASGVNYGGVRRQGRPPEQLPLSQRSHAIWPRLQQLIGIDGEFLRSGHLKLARSAEDMASLEQYAADVAPFGLDLELVGHNQLSERFGIGGEVIGGSFCRGDGHANPRLVSTAFAAAARHAGAEVLENTEVVGLARTFEGFTLEAGDVAIKSRIVINSAGAWADNFARAFGEAVPLERTYPSLVVTEPLDLFLSVNIGIEGGGIYARQVTRGNVVVGGERAAPLDDPDFSRPRSDGVLTIMQRASELFGPLRHVQAIRFWSGTEATMPDRNPVIGPSATTPGLFHAFGFSGAGFQIAPGVGEVLAELVRDGETSTPIAPFAITRFSPASQPGDASQAAMTTGSKETSP
ncbi:NAD(P)/FAD-dependent oxidoreductase [Bradyrhizobium oligotrophicum]|uniref:NAD(P)/FAD-dependent oxidoreductase n=1 Tax=Bradyrhizobium oligotrophicum TaxID=44255 RepID=UPI003EB7D437